MDDRGAIEKVNEIKNQIMNNTFQTRGGRSRAQHYSVSPPSMKHQLHLKNTNLRFYQ